LSHHQPPAYWLTRSQAVSLARYVRGGEVEQLNQLIHNEAKEVPEAKDEIYATLFGEMIPFLRVEVNIPFPDSLKPPAELSRDERLRMAGVCYLLDRHEAAAADRGVETFMQTADEDILCGDGALLILYMDAPQAVRAGIAPFQKALKIPDPYEYVLFVTR
jgi:hypothetical protein